jgi:hypothetical protein
MAKVNDPKERAKYQQILDREVSEYRITALKNQGTNIAKICNKYANFIENSIKNIEKE